MKSAFPFGVFLTVLACVTGFVALNSLHSALDNDTWWHLRIGKFVCETGTVPETDPISRHGIDNRVPWRAYSWLHEVILYQTHKHGGVTGLMWLKTLFTILSTATVFAFVLRQAGTTLFGFIALAGMSMLIYPMGTERPWHITIAFTTLTLWKAIHIREGEPVWRSWWLIPLFIFWANTHIQFVLGWGILGLAFLFPGKANRWHAGCLTAACIAATVVNPYHIWLFQVIWEYATQNTLRALVQELSPPDRNSRFTISMALLMSCGYAQWFSRRMWDGFELGILLAGTYFASKMFRDLWFGGLVAVAVLHTVRQATATTKQLWATVGTVAITYLIVRSIFCLGLLRSNDYAAANEKRYPVKAVEFIREHRPPGPLYNDFDWGGYLSWELPDYPVSVDGRTNLYGNTMLLESWDTWLAKDGWESNAMFQRSNVVLSEKEVPLAKKLIEMPDRWKVAYEDDTTYVFIRR